MGSKFINQTTPRQYRYRDARRYLSGFAAVAVLVLSAGPAAAKNLYVATNGDNAVSYSANSEATPWRTIIHGVYNLRAGDTLYIRGGNYSPKYKMVVRSDFYNDTQGGDPNEDMNAESGTAGKPVRITSYPGERVVIDCANVYIWLDLEGKDYWEVSNLEFINAAMVVRAGNNTEATNAIIRGNRIQMNRGGDNLAAIKLENVRADSALIEGNIIIGPGGGSSIHANTGTIYMRIIKNVKVLGNVLSNAPIGIHYKHATGSGDFSDTDIEIAYNYITNTRRGGMMMNANRAHIHNNIFGAGTSAIVFTMANGTAGGDFNTIEHNTFYSVSLSLQNDAHSGDSLPGSVGNVIRNNLFTSAVLIHPYQQYAHDSEMNFNLHDSSAAVVEHSVDYSLSAWRSRSSGSVNSASGSVRFVGGSSPSSISGFELAAGSPGKGMAPGGRDVGANVALVGQGAPLRPVPVPPGNLN